ncbi:alpha/beta hydrolase [Gulosibacter chungangensis]|uniref:Alpha/beta hydrolase n=1 Tax=Gulosibacter chungangensis TaxID=979746 RepID=A0A7J5BGA0_9MICO|nr:alpha/beta hydrolase [Gulosibacter chungangensis]KAB1644922.1 alpha/beta hydrolase [Gulosibacter chungangensis]
MNPLMKAALGLFAAPRIDMREDYGKVRRAQRWFASLWRPGLRNSYRQTTATVGDRKIRVRIFQPIERRGDDILLFFHGGGWVTGDIETYTTTCRAMAELTGCPVASVNYRLAPEHPYPAGLEDCYGITKQLLEEPQRAGISDARNIVLVGDSAGGNLAAAVSLRLRDEGHVGVTRQILLYPVTHWDHDPTTSPFDSVREYGEHLRLTNAEVQAYMDLYVPDAQAQREPYVSPLMAKDFSDQPRTLLISAGWDLLRDEGEAYGKALQDAGNEVQVHRVPEALHGFIQLPRFTRQMRDAYEVINAFLDEPEHRHDAAKQPEAGPGA